MTTDTPLVEVRDLAKHYPVYRGILFPRMVGAVHAVDGVSFVLWPGETLGLVGESGCGKSTLARLVLRLIEASAGEVRFEGEDLRTAPSDRLQQLRKDMQMVFQDPFASLNPRMTVGDNIAEPLRIYRTVPASDRRARIRELLEIVGLEASHADRYPHEFSGGQRQRIGIARALALRPKLVVCDEPVSALDVSIQAQIINLLQDLQAEFRLSYLFISHDLAVVRHMSDRIAVMYLGRIVETGPTEMLFHQPRHPYTRALLSVVPDPSTRKRRPRAVLEGEIPDPLSPPSGCRFRTRCPHVVELCATADPRLEQVDHDHMVACHRHALFAGG